MSKRPYTDQSTVSTIKIRKLENDNYQIDNRSTSEYNVKTEPEDDYNSSYSHDMYNSGQSYMEYDPLAPDYNSSAQNSYNPLPDTNDGELVCTPSFDAFDSIIQSQEDEDDSNEPFLNLPLEIKINSIHSMANQNSSSFPTRSTAQPEIQDANGYIDSIYETENGDNQSAQGAKPVKKRRAIRHLVYIFADDGNRYFPCHCCTSAFIKKYLLIKHIVTKHKDIIVCKLCACIFTQQMQNSYQQHMKAHNMRLPTQTKQCPLCLFWLTPKCYQGHLSSHNLLQKHICRQCRQEFPSFYVRAKHVCPMRIY
ncbi:uncharacterized protein LOC123301735 [Chrysoperla carnea]|uniref:uncharacterized protein LOC123301735 n=1 Tax=Chrysoperla carnea TaxID=189513 RepID=UPI001D0775F8|nr:uncharacterized protein LOC123301735 [Chrysoperla carnea]